MGLLKDVVRRFMAPFGVKVLAVMVLFPVLAFVEPLIQKRLFDVSIYERNLNGFLITLIIFATLALLAVLIEYAYSLFSVKLNNDIALYLLGKFLPRYYRLGYREVSKADAGYYLSRVYEEPQEAVINTLDVLFRLLGSVVGAVARLMAMLMLSPWGTVIVLPAALVSYLLARKFGDKVSHISKEQMEKEAQLRGVLTDVLKAHTFVRAFRLVDWVKDHTLRHAGKFFRTLYRYHFLTETYVLISSMAGMTIQVVLISVNVYLLFRGNITVGDFFGFMAAFYPFYSSLNGIFNGIPQLIAGFSQLERVESFLKAEDDRWYSIGNRIVLKDVSFSYSSKTILRGVSLTVDKGERVLVMGANGSGKSTLLRIMAGLLKPQRGEVMTFEEVSLTPEHVLMDVPIGDYLKVRGFEIGTLRRLIKEFNIPQDKRPSQLSAGQLKKFIVALALSKPAECYMLDEPFENLDVESVPKVAEAILRRAEGKALVVVMHGKENLRGHFDRVLEMKDGRVFMRRGKEYERHFSKKPNLDKKGG